MNSLIFTNVSDQDVTVNYFGHSLLALFFVTIIIIMPRCVAQRRHTVVW